MPDPVTCWLLDCCQRLMLVFEIFGPILSAMYVRPGS
jgi:hypothetical protein